MEVVADCLASPATLLVTTHDDVKLLIKVLEERKFVKQGECFVKNKAQVTIQLSDQDVSIVPKDSFVICLRRDKDEKPKLERGMTLTSS